MSTNRISASVPQDVITKSLNALNEVKSLLQPYLQSLTTEERRRLPKMGDDSFSFVDKAHEYSSSNPEFNPAFSEPVEFQKDFTIAVALKPVLSFCEQLCSNIDDTMLLAGSEAYQGALLYYGSVQMGAKTGQPNAKPIAEDLANRFPGRKKKKTGTEPGTAGE